jgi:hypothetical protein
LRRVSCGGVCASHPTVASEAGNEAAKKRTDALLKAAAEKRHKDLIASGAIPDPNLPRGPPAHMMGGMGRGMGMPGMGMGMGMGMARGPHMGMPPRGMGRGFPMGVQQPHGGMQPAVPAMPAYHPPTIEEASQSAAKSVAGLGWNGSAISSTVEKKPVAAAPAGGLLPAPAASGVRPGPTTGFGMPPMGMGGARPLPPGPTTGFGMPPPSQQPLLGARPAAAPAPAPGPTTGFGTQPAPAAARSLPPPSRGGGPPPLPARTKPVARPGSAVLGRGRGKSSTLPAWMTRPSS